MNMSEKSQISCSLSNKSVPAAYWTENKFKSNLQGGRARRFVTHRFVTHVVVSESEH